MAAESTLMLTLRPGDHVLLADDVYGGTYRLLSKVLEPWGLSFSTVDLNDVDAIRGAFRPQTRVVWFETPSNPLLKIVDLEAVCTRRARGGRSRRRGQHVRDARTCSARSSSEPTRSCTA